MNIYISKNEANILNQRLITKIKMGSHLYGTNNEKSDIDYLCIYKTFDEELYSGLPNFHQFQYKDIDNNVDYIYCSELQFDKNFISGDATINTDIVLFSDDEFIKEKYYNSLDRCRTYKIIKSYLGFAKRDIKQINNDNINKKICHIYRGFYMVESLLDRKYPTIKEIQKIYKKSKLINSDVLVNKEKELREKVNDLYNKNELVNYYIDNCNDSLIYKMWNSNNTKEFKY